MRLALPTPLLRERPRRMDLASFEVLRDDRPRELGLLHMVEHGDRTRRFSARLRARLHRTKPLHLLNTLDAIVDRAHLILYEAGARCGQSDTPMCPVDSIAVIGGRNEYRRPRMPRSPENRAVCRPPPRPVDDDEVVVGRGDDLRPHRVYRDWPAQLRDRGF